MQNVSIFRNRSFVTLIVLLFVSIGLMFSNLKTSVSIRSIFFFIVYPFQYAASSVGGFFVNSVNSFSRVHELEDDLDAARQRLQKYQEELLLYQQMEKENQDLRNVLEMRQKQTFTTHYARIIGRDPTLSGDYFIIDKGFMDGLHDNMPVVNYDSNNRIVLIGRTVETGFAGSKVQTITSYDTSIGITLKTTGYFGILRGRGSWHENCIVDYIPAEAESYISEEVLTSGESGIYPDGLLVGTVVGIGKNTIEEFFSKLYVRPVMRYQKLKDVFILDWKPVKEAENVTGEQK
jgi:rod shape-determining protein MreC